MTEPLTADDLARMRQKHRPDNSLTYCVVCNPERDPVWPCDAVRLCDEVERLRRVENLAMAVLEEIDGQSEAPTVSDGGKG